MSVTFKTKHYQIRSCNRTRIYFSACVFNQEITWRAERNLLQNCHKIRWYFRRIWCFSDCASQYRLFSSYQRNAYFLYSRKIYMLHYNPQHVSSSTLLIFRRTNCIITASGIVTQTAVQYAGWERTAVRSQPAYCTAVYREWRYQRL